MFERILMCGSGGQGVILAGKILANSAVEVVPHLTFFPDYGAEVRGGTSKCQIVFSSDEISSPVSDLFDSMIVMNQESLNCFIGLIDTKGLVIINSSLCTAPQNNINKIMKVPATEIAESLGDVRSANFVMLGAYIKQRDFIKKDHVESEIKKSFSGKAGLLEVNLEAFRKGNSL